MIVRRGRSSHLYGSLMILVGLATRRYGLTVVELMREAKLSRAQTYRQIKALESLGVEITRHKEPVRSSWRTLYRLQAIRGLRFKIEGQREL